MIRMIRPLQNWLNLPKQLIFFGKKHVFMFPGKSIIDILWKLFRSLFPWSMEKKTSWLAKDHFSILFNSCSPLFPGNKENFMALTPWPLSVTMVPRSSIMCHDTRGQIWMDAGVPRRWSRCVLYCQQFSLWSIWVNYNHLTVLPHWKS